jgi:hypothetical protein
MTGARLHTREVPMASKKMSMSPSEVSPSPQYVPSAVDEDETHEVLPHAHVWESKQDEQHTWRQVMPDQEYWYYPMQLSGGKHENTYLCFADAKHTLPFVLKILPTSLRSMPHKATGVMDPASLEFRIYSRLQEELEAGATLHYPCLYHAEFLNRIFLPKLLLVFLRFNFI